MHEWEGVRGGDEDCGLWKDGFFLSITTGWVLYNWQPGGEPWVKYYFLCVDIMYAP